MFRDYSGQTNPIGKFPPANVVQLTLIGNGNDGTPVGTAEAIPSPLSDDGLSFSVGFVDFTTLCPTSGCAEGAFPLAALVQATDGNLYGTTSEGGASGYGMVFKITPSGTLTTLYSFCSQSGCTDGASPYAALVQATDGNLYGTTYEGGDIGYGTVFKITPSGALTTLYSFCSQSPCMDGGNPEGTLVQATDGNLYGRRLAKASGSRFLAVTIPSRFRQQGARFG
jgi:uncharacterized repeat protein (TIGR03803 family)